MIEVPKISPMHFISDHEQSNIDKFIQLLIFNRLLQIFIVLSLFLETSCLQDPKIFL